MKAEMERNAEVPASSRDEALFFPAAMREEPRGGPRNAKEDLTSLRKHESSPRSTGNSRGTLSFLPQVHTHHEILPCYLRSPFNAAPFPKKAHVHSWNSKGYLTRFRKLRNFPRYPSALERITEFPTTSQEEQHFPLLKSR